jgi:hypothetical protein
MRILKFNEIYDALKSKYLQFFRHSGHFARPGRDKPFTVTTEPMHSMMEIVANGRCEEQRRDMVCAKKRLT